MFPRLVIPAAASLKTISSPRLVDFAMCKFPGFDKVRMKMF